MSIVELYLKEFDDEGIITRKMLKLVPSERFDWRPHPKSMSLKQLGTHLAELPGWVTVVLNSSELDLADYAPTEVNNQEELAAVFEKSYAEGHESLSKAKEEDLLPKWTLRAGDVIYKEYASRQAIIRELISQQIHHRAQLGVFLRLLDIPIPGSYGPSADGE